jgi:hypothetical protein
MRGDTLRMPTVAVNVELAIGPSQPHTSRGELFVIDDPRQQANPVDAVAQLLESPAQFVPFRVDGVVRLVAKTAIVTVTIPGAPPQQTDEPELELYDRQHRVEVLLVQGTRFEGLLLDNSPADHPRAIDHLNSTARHVRLWTADSHVLIAKAQIATVTELPEAE